MGHWTHQRIKQLLLSLEANLLPHSAARHPTAFPEVPSAPRPQEGQSEATVSAAHPERKSQDRKSHEVQKATLRDDFSDGWKKFKKEAGVVFLGDAIRERSSAAREKGVITFQPYGPEVCPLLTFKPLRNHA